jgi:hypothetical protein
MRHRFSMRRLVVVSPLFVPPSHLPWLVVASPLVAPPLPLNVPAAASRRNIASPCVGASNSLSPFVKNTPPTPSRLFCLDAGCQRMSGQRWEYCLVFGLGGGMWCIFNSPEKKIKKSPMFYCCILCYASDVSFFQSRVRFMLAHKINFGTEKRATQTVLGRMANLK